VEITESSDRNRGKQMCRSSVAESTVEEVNKIGERKSDNKGI
jgi:hypothetical protein